MPTYNIPYIKTRLLYAGCIIPQGGGAYGDGNDGYMEAPEWCVPSAATFNKDIGGFDGDMYAQENTGDTRTGTVTVHVESRPCSGWNGTLSITCAWTVTQAAGGSTPPTQAYVTYNAVGHLNNQANVDLAVVIESYDSGRDVDTFSLIPTESEKAGDIDVQLNPTAGTTNLRFIVSVTGFSASVDGQLSMRVAYADYDSDYQAIGTGGAIDFYKDYQSAAPLIIDVIFTPSNQ